MKHPHKYEKITYPSGTEIMKCQLPGCTHFIRIELAENRLAVCWRCGENFLLTKKILKLKKPHCINCTRHKSEDLDKALEALLQ